MTRKLLIAQMRQAASLCDYKFHTGMEYRMNTDITKLPAIWLTPPKLLKKEGREQGVKQYLVKIFIIEKCQTHTPEFKEKTWAHLENILDEFIKNTMENENIRDVADIEYKPEEFSLTNNGEISITAEFKIKINF